MIALSAATTLSPMRNRRPPVTIARILPVSIGTLIVSSSCAAAKVRLPMRRSGRNSGISSAVAASALVVSTSYASIVNVAGTCDRAVSRYSRKCELSGRVIGTSGESAGKPTGRKLRVIES